MSLLKTYARLAELGAAVESGIAELVLDGTVHFSAQRRAVRQWLEQSKEGQEIEKLVAKLLA